MANRLMSIFQRLIEPKDNSPDSDRKEEREKIERRLQLQAARLRGLDAQVDLGRRKPPNEH